MTMTVGQQRWSVSICSHYINEISGINVDDDDSNDNDDSDDEYSDDDNGDGDDVGDDYGADGNGGDDGDYKLKLLNTYGIMYIICIYF